MRPLPSWLYTRDIRVDVGPGIVAEVGCGGGGGNVGDSAGKMARPRAADVARPWRFESTFRTAVPASAAGGSGDWGNWGTTYF